MDSIRTLPNMTFFTILIYGRCSMTSDLELEKPRLYVEIHEITKCRGRLNRSFNIVESIKNLESLLKVC